MMSTQVTLLAITSVLTLLSLVRAPYPAEQALQHIPTGVAIALLAIAIHRRWLSTVALACTIAFLWLHILGARYIYSYVPYDDWLQALTGGSLAQWFGWSRNHYDRLVHLLFGVLIVVPAAEVAEQHGRLHRSWAIAFAICFVTAISAGYEIVEWLVAIVMSPQHAEAYNGQQGDPWDAQKDMALALVGSGVTAFCLGIRARFRRH